MRESAELRFERPSEVLLEHLRRDGYAEGIKLTREACDGLVAYAESSHFCGNAGGSDIRPQDFHTHPKSFLFRRQSPHVDSEIVRRVAHDARLTTLVAEYLGANPILHSSQMWFSLSLPSGRTAAVNPEYGFHYDIDDFKFLKVFFYLTDVDLKCGPHVAIAGSHADFSIRKKWRRRLSDAQASELLGSHKVFVGPAGTGFVEDTNLYHKGMAPERPRLVLQIEYSLTPLFRCLEGR